MMNSQSLTLNVPEPLFVRLQERAAQSQRSIEQETLDALAAHIAVEDELPDDAASVLAQLALMNDEDLWRAARNRLATEASTHLEDLHFKQQREGLTPEEAQMANDLERQYERAMLVRAEAAALLHQRGHNLDELLKKP